VSFSSTPNSAVPRLLSVLLLVSTAAAGAERPSLVRYEATATVMGCTFGVAAYGPGREVLAGQVEAAFEEARRIDAWLSNYRADSDLSRLNRSAAQSPTAVSDELFNLLAQAAGYSGASEGAFDMTVGPLVRTWGFYEGSGRLAGDDEVDQALEKTGYRFVELDPVHKTVRFTRPGVELDPGGIGKGYAVDRMVEVLRLAGVKAALVNACHSSIYGLGAPPDDPSGWMLEIENAVGGVAETLVLKDESLSTSGSQEKFFEAGGVTYSHIIDPRSGRPAAGVAAISVVAPTALDSEVWSTAIFVNGLDWSSRRAPAGLRVYACPAGSGCRWLPPRP